MMDVEVKQEFQEDCKRRAWKGVLKAFFNGIPVPTSSVVGASMSDENQNPINLQK